MDKPLLALPYLGPSCSVDVLERVVKRDLCARGRIWADLPAAKRNAHLGEAQELLQNALRMVLDDALVDARSFFPSGAIQTYEQLDDLIGMLGWLETVHRNRSRTAANLLQYVQGLP